jgi:hypothetical protein
VAICLTSNARIAQRGVGVRDGEAAIYQAISGLVVEKARDGR